jgi:hypothetical protein
MRRNNLRRDTIEKNLTFEIPSFAIPKSWGRKVIQSIVTETQKCRLHFPEWIHSLKVNRGRTFTLAS